MSGGLMQIVAQGAQDKYLTVNPEITFFKSMYRRHTNFAMESIEQTFNGSQAANGKVSATISRNGDLVHRMWLEFDVDSTKAIRPILTTNAVIDTSNNNFEFASAHGLTEGTPVVVRESAAQVTVAGDAQEGTKTYYVKEHASDATKFHLKATPATTDTTALALGGGNQSAPWDVIEVVKHNLGNGTRQPYDAYDLIDNVSVEIGGTRVDRHYGDWLRIRDELTCPAGGKRTALDACVKGNGTTAAVAAADQKVRIPLSFWFCKDAGSALPLIALQYHEVKVSVEFSDHSAMEEAKASLWVDYIYLDTAERQRFARSGHQYLIEQVQTVRGETIGTAGSTDKLDRIRLDMNHPVKELIWNVTGVTTTGPVSTQSKLVLNGHDRFAERDAEYFRDVQQYQHHTSQSPAFVYSFALEPEKLQPSGTCNFSRIDNATLQLNTKTNAGQVNIYAVNYNVLRIKNGMGGLAYSN